MYESAVVALKMSVGVRVTEVAKERSNMFGLHYFYVQVRENANLVW